MNIQTDVKRDLMASIKEVGSVQKTFLPHHLYQPVPMLTEV